jgi:3-dehydroquinate dehydratase-2
MAKPIYVLNGANLNLVGSRQTELYGADTLADLQRRCEAAGARLGYAVEFRHSNEPGDLIDWVQEAEDKAAAVLLNPGAYWNIFPALAEAVDALSIPLVEAHLSAPYSAEVFREVPYVTLGKSGVIMGLGAASYELGISALAGILAA